MKKWWLDTEIFPIEHNVENFNWCNSFKIHNLLFFFKNLGKKKKDPFVGDKNLLVPELKGTKST